jgi:transcriptional regulator with XRE-family HTH domain
MTRLAHERHKKNLSQKQVAERIGLGYSSYFKIEQGRFIPGKHSGTAERLQDFFGMRLGTLLRDVR